MGWLSKLFGAGTGDPPEGKAFPDVQGPDGVRSYGHRDYVGGLWDELGKLQFEFLVKEGLKPEHYLLDIACGSLRAGVHFIPYLDPGHYLGMEKEALLIESGVEKELGQVLFEEKHPQLIVSDAFDFERFGVQPNFALSQSLFTHLPSGHIKKCLERLRSVIQDSGVFYATFFESENRVDNPTDPNDHGTFAFTREEMESLGCETGWAFEYIGDWNHPRHQVMVRYQTK